MNVSKINLFFLKAGCFQIKYRIPLLIIITVFTGISFIGLSKMKLSKNDSEWFEDYEQVKINQDRFENTFGNNDSVMVLIQADDVFAPEVLDAIDRLGKRLEQEVPYADEVTSLTTVLIPQGTEDGFRVISPFEDGIPSDPQEIEKIKRFILSKESLVNNLVSESSKETWLILSLTPYDTLGEDLLKIGYAAQKVILSEEFQSSNYSLKPTGIAYTEAEEHDTASKEASKRVLAGFMVMLFCLIIFLRSIRGVIVPVIATLGGIGCVFGIMSFMNISADANLITLPILLGMALSVGYSIHYVNSFKMLFRRTGLRKSSAEEAVGYCGWSILFTVITTVACMLSFVGAGIKPIKWLGVTAACIVFSVYVYVIIFIPVLMSFGKDKAVDLKTSLHDGATKTDLAFYNLGNSVLKNYIPIIIVSVMLIAAAVPGIFKIKVNMDYIEMMGNKIPYIARLIEILNAELGSQYSYDAVIEFKDEDEFKKPENMYALESFEKELGNLKLTRISAGKPRVNSVVNIVKEMNRTINGGDISDYKIPEQQDFLTQLLFLYEISGGNNLFKWIDEDYKTAHIHVELKGYDANTIVEDINNACAAGKRIFPNAEISIVGLVANYASMNRKLVIGELKSFCGSFTIILILLSIAFLSIKTGLIGMIPNIAPVIFIGGIMGYLNFSLDMMTMTIMPMILGIAVDDTIHFTNSIKYEFEKTGSYKESILISFKEIGKTLGITTFILCSMFFVYTFSPLNTMFRIGMLAIIGLASALIADFTLTPVLICLIKPFGKEKKVEQ